MAEQWHSSLSSPSTVPVVGWSGIKYTTTRPWSSGNVLSCSSDESCFTNWQTDGWILVWRMPGERCFWIPSANCEVCWKRIMLMGCFMVWARPLYNFLRGIYSKIYFRQQSASNFIATVWGGRPFPVLTWQSLCAQIQVHKEIIFPVLCWRMSLAWTEPWPL